MTTASENIRFICDSCGFRARIPGTYKGKVILCPGCQAMKIVAPDGSDPTGSTVAVRRVETATVPTGTFSNPDAAGKIRFTCSKCGYLAKLGAHYAGKAIACPSCETPQLIPPLAPAAVAAPRAEIELALDLSAPSAPAEPPAPHPTPAAKPAPAAPAAAAAEDGDLSLDEPETLAKPDLSDELASVAPLADLPTGLIGEPAATAAPGKPATKLQVRGQPGTPAAPAPRAAAKSEKAAAEESRTKPKTGSVVRRGGRPDDVEEEDAESADENDDTDTPPAKPVVAAKAAGMSGRFVKAINKLPVLSVTIVAAVSTVLMLTFLILWRGSAGEAADWKTTAIDNKQQFTTETEAHKDTELKRLGVTSELKDANGKLEAALAAGKKTEEERAAAESESRTAKTEAESERTQRKTAEGKLDAALAKAAKAESERDEALRQYLEKSKALKEETAMRKQFQDRVKELDAKTK